MYRVIWYKDYKDTKGTVIHDTTQISAKITNGIIEQSLSKIWTFSFTVDINNPCFRKLENLISLITVINTKTGVKEFEGRVRNTESIKMDLNGHFSQTVQCVGLLDYLHDSCQRYKDVDLSNLREYLQTIVNRHNRTVENHKRFVLGDVTVSSNTGNVYRGIGYDTTFETIKDKLIDRLGGTIVLQNINGEMILNYLSDVGRKVEQPIAITRNMIDASLSVNTDELITRLVPIGAEIEVEGEEINNSILARECYTIGGVNNGVDYLDDQTLISEFGIIERSVKWSDTKDIRFLKTKGEQYLRDQRVALITWGVTTINLDLLDERYEPFELGNYYPIQNEFLTDKVYQQIVNKKIDILNPHKLDLVLGTENQTLSAFQLQYRGFSDELENANKRIDNSRKSLDELKEEAKKLQEMANRVPEQEKMLRELEEQIAIKEQQQKKDFDAINKLVKEQDERLKKQDERIKELEKSGQKGE